MFRFLLFTFCILIAASNLAFAEEPRFVPFEDVRNMSKQVLEECQSTQNQIYDCSCMFISYMNTRSKKVEQPSHEETLDVVKKRCLRPGVDPSVIPGVQYSAEGPYSESETNQTARFYEKCQSDSELSSLYDCSCMKDKYIQQLHLLNARDAAAGDDTVLLGVEGECRSANGSEKNGYALCMASKFAFVPMKLRNNPEPFCSCYGRIFSEKFMSYPNKDVNAALQSIRSETLSLCNLEMGAF